MCTYYRYSTIIDTQHMRANVMDKKNHCVQKLLDHPIDFPPFSTYLIETDGDVLCDLALDQMKGCV